MVLQYVCEHVHTQLNLSNFLPRRSWFDLLDPGCTTGTVGSVSTRVEAYCVGTRFVSRPPSLSHSTSLAVGASDGTDHSCPEPEQTRNPAPDLCSYVSFHRGWFACSTFFSSFCLLPSVFQGFFFRDDLLVLSFAWRPLLSRERCAK